MREAKEKDRGMTEEEKEGKGFWSPQNQPPQNAKIKRDIGV
jgi:hypothetical protein